MAAIAERYNEKLEAAEIELEHEHIQDELADLAAALDDVDLDAQPVPQLNGLSEAEAIVRSLLAEMPQHFLAEETSLMPSVCEQRPQAEKAAGMLMHHHRHIWEALNLLEAELRALGRSTDLAEDVAVVQQHAQRLRNAIATHIEAEELLYRAIAG